MKARAHQRRYLRIDDVVFNSEAFKTLPGGALKLWVDLRTQYRGSNNGDISAALSILKHRGWNSTSKLQRAMAELLERRLIDRTRAGKAGPNKMCSLFGFTDLAVARNEAKFIEGRQPTHAYATWQPSAMQKFRAPETGAELHPKQAQNCARIGNEPASDCARNRRTETRETTRITPTNQTARAVSTAIDYSHPKQAHSIDSQGMGAPVPPLPLPLRSSASDEFVRSKLRYKARAARLARAREANRRR